MDLSTAHPFESSFMAMGDGTHKPPIKADVRKAIAKEEGDSVAVRLFERLGKKRHLGSQASPPILSAAGARLAGW